MKKIFLGLSLTSVSLLQASCISCEQRELFRDNFRLVGTFNHGAPVEAVSALCSCNGENYIAVAGYADFDCLYAKSIRILKFQPITRQFEEVAVDLPRPSEYLFSVAGQCINNDGYETPLFIFTGCPDEHGDVVWVYELQSQDGFTQIASWGRNEDPRPLTQYSVAINPKLCPNMLQFAVVGKAINNVAHVYILNLVQNEISRQAIIELYGGDLYTATWLPSQTKIGCNCDIGCTVLSVGGTMVTGKDCHQGNIHNFAVTCDNVVTEIISLQGSGVIKLGRDYTVRHLVWCTNCDKYPYPFLLATGDHTALDGHGIVESKVVVYYYNPITGIFKKLATKKLPGKIFAAEFTPDCDCKSVIVGGGCLDDILLAPCTNEAWSSVDICSVKHPANIWRLDYDCAPNGKYPVKMDIKGSTTFPCPDHNEQVIQPSRQVITSLAFCKVDDSLRLILTSESKDYKRSGIDPLCQQKTQDEIAFYKIKSCTNIKPCLPQPACQRNINQREIDK